MKSRRVSLQLVTALAFIFSLAVCAQAQTVTYLVAETSLGLIQATDGNFVTK